MKRAPSTELSPNQLAGAVVQMLTRLNDHISRLDDGALYAVDDIAVVLRTLIGDGKGNRVLQQLARRYNVKLPRVQLSQPVGRGVNVRFALGSLPVQHPAARLHGAESKTVDQWMNETVIVIEENGHQRRLRWETFISDYANKWGGAHLDLSTPNYLPLIDRYGAGGLALSAYLIRSAAVEALRIGDQTIMSLAYLSGIVPSVHGTARATGAPDKEPTVLRAYGEIQHFRRTDDAIDYLFYVERGSDKSNFSFLSGEVGWNLGVSFDASDASREPASPTSKGPRTYDEPTEPIVIDPEHVTFLRVSGRVVQFEQLDVWTMMATDPIARSNTDDAHG